MSASAISTVTCGVSITGATMIFLSTMSMTEPVMTSPFLSVNVVWKNWPLIVADGSRIDCRMKSRVHLRADRREIRREAGALRLGAERVTARRTPPS